MTKNNNIKQKIQEAFNTVKLESVKMIPKTIVSVILLGTVSYGYINTLTILPASSESFTKTQKSNFIHASMVDVDHYISNDPQCHIFEIAHDINSCHNVKALVYDNKGWCIHPKLPGKC